MVTTRARSCAGLLAAAEAQRVPHRAMVAAVAAVVRLAWDDGGASLLGRATFARDEGVGLDDAEALLLAVECWTAGGIEPDEVRRLNVGRALHRGAFPAHVQRREACVALGPADRPSRATCAILERCARSAEDRAAVRDVEGLCALTEALLHLAGFAWYRAAQGGTDGTGYGAVACARTADVLWMLGDRDTRRAAGPSAADARVLHVMRRALGVTLPARGAVRTGFALSSVSSP